ncbi:SDR family NAD(P)-dependent oxidoreductase [Rhodococcus kronopolitis]|uniref:SDR family NAD(P)-dependent oxidoreductase n=1 Tax=Rhodococcus kronopolitis TaxID=1460226 RepID=A0ABV9FT48_9NOCA
MARNLEADLTGRRVLITGAARGIGAGLARRLHERGARVALLGLEPELLEQVATASGRAPWRHCDVSDQRQVEDAVEHLAERLGGLDVVVANAGVGAPLSLVDGDPEIMRRAVEVNLMGTYFTLRAAGPHIGHAAGYALVVASTPTANRLPLRGAFSATRAGVEALGHAFRLEMRPLGTRVGIAHLGEIDTDRTEISFDGAVAGGGSGTVGSPVSVVIDAFERGIAARKTRIYAPRRVPGATSVRMLAHQATHLVPARARSAHEGAL